MGTLPKAFSFQILHRSSKSLARVGKISTLHGDIHTPSFVSVGTNASVKGLTSQQILSTNLELLFCNTFHLLVHPGVDTIQQAGGIHRFMNYKGPIITDSGGFQVFSLRREPLGGFKKSSKNVKYNNNLVVKISEEGVVFRSYRNGSHIFLTPESSIQAQKKIKSDIIVSFDELPCVAASCDQLLSSFERTHRWEIRSLKEHLKSPENQAIYSVIHGGVDISLREKSINLLCSEPFDGHSIGGSLGQTKEEMIKLLRGLSVMLPRDKPCHLLGVGDIFCITNTVGFGIDTYDSSFPTKLARHGRLLVRDGCINIKSTAFLNDFGPIERGCLCFTCANHSRSYVHHLFKANELTALTLASIHNVHFMCAFMSQLREKILNDEI